ETSAGTGSWSPASGAGGAAGSAEPGNTSVSSASSVGAVATDPSGWVVADPPTGAGSVGECPRGGEPDDAGAVSSAPGRPVPIRLPASAAIPSPVPSTDPDRRKPSVAAVTTATV